MHLRRFALMVLTLGPALALRAEPALVAPTQALANLPYKQGAALTGYEKERCKLDLYLPQGDKDFATLVWFHGGGLNAGNKEGKDTIKIAQSLAAAGIAVAVPNYRLSPKVHFPAYIEDAAAACAWTQVHIGEHGGSAKKLFIGGHSAGGYLALMLGMDTHYLADLGLQPSAIAGFIPVSGQTMTHYTVRQERGIGKFTVTADAAAPVYFARKDTRPFLVLYADHDMAARAEENAYFVALMKGAGNQVTTGQLITDRTHGTVATKIAEKGDPGRKAILSFIQSVTPTKSL